MVEKVDVDVDLDLNTLKHLDHYKVGALVGRLVWPAD